MAKHTMNDAAAQRVAGRLRRCEDMTYQEVLSALREEGFVRADRQVAPLMSKLRRAGDEGLSWAIGVAAAEEACALRRVVRAASAGVRLLMSEGGALDGPAGL